VHLSAQLLYFADSLEHFFYPTWLRVSYGFLALSALLAAGGFVAALAGFQRATARRQPLGLASAFFAASGAAAFSYHVIRGVHYAAHGVAGRFVAAEMAGAAGSVAFAAAGVIAAVAFLSTSNGPRRDFVLGWAAVGLAAYFSLTFISWLLYAVAYSRFPAPRGFVGGLALESAGAAVGAAGAAAAAIAFLRSNPDAEQQRLGARDGLLAVAATDVGLGYLVSAIGALVYAGSLSSLETDSKEVAANWLSGVNYLGLACAAICAGVAFRISRRGLEHRDGSDPAAFADPG